MHEGAGGLRAAKLQSSLRLLLGRRTMAAAACEHGALSRSKQAERPLCGPDGRPLPRQSQLARHHDRDLQVAEGCVLLRI